MAERHGLLARFESPQALTAAVHALQADGYRRLEAFSPYPVAGLGESLGAKAGRIPVIALLAALLAAAGGYLMQWYSAAVAYPFVVGGKPLHGWPAFMLVTTALTILAAVLAAVVAMLACNRLPRLYHPAFHVAGFERATGDGFFLLVAAADPRFEADATARRLRDLAAAEIAEVPP